MRKTSGTITGDIKLNGFPQERISLLRCSEYVEQVRSTAARRDVSCLCRELLLTLRTFFSLLPHVKVRCSTA